MIVKVSTLKPTDKWIVVFTLHYNILQNTYL